MVTNFVDKDSILRALKLKSNQVELNVVNVKWLTDSNKSAKLCAVDDKQYFLMRLGGGGESTSDDDQSKKATLDNFTLADYECQRETPAIHLNQNLTV